MPELDGVSLFAMASFGVLMVAWILMPVKAEKVAEREVVTEPRAAYVSG